MLTFNWYRIRISFQVLGSSSIKHLFSFGSKIGPHRTTHLRSSTNSLKCATLYECYEYGLDRRQTRFRRRNLFGAFSASQSQSASRIEVVRWCMQVTRMFLRPSHLVLFLFPMLLPIIWNFCSQTGTKTNNSMARLSSQYSNNFNMLYIHIFYFVSFN